MEAAQASVLTFENTAVGPQERLVAIRTVGAQERGRGIA